MATTNALPLVAGGVAVIVLSFGAGMFGGSFATPPNMEPTTGSAVGADAGSRAHIEELDRRVVNLEERMRVVEDTANSALQRAQQIDGLRREIEALKSGNTFRMPANPPPVANDVPAEQRPTLTVAERQERDRQRTDELRKSMLKIAKRNGSMLLKSQLGVIANGTDQGDADRRSQVIGQSKRMATLYALTPAEEETVREILSEEFASSVRDVAPFLAGGIEKADIAQVKPKLGAIWDRRNARMADVLDEDEYEQYTSDQNEWRKIFDSTLDEMERQRLTR
jgi:hypothetical protein